MRIIADIKIYDGEQSYPPETVINWPDDRPLPTQDGANIRPASPEDAPAVIGALRRGLNDRIAKQKAFLKRPGLKAEAIEIAHNALAKYEEQLAQLPEPAPVDGAAKLNKGGADPLS